MEAETKPEPKPAKKSPKQVQVAKETTGLADYGFWHQQMTKEQAERKETDGVQGVPGNLRRGRIWC